MPVRTYEVRRVSADPHGLRGTIRDVATVSKYIDTTSCIGCKACEVACQEWNDLPPLENAQAPGTYQTRPALDAGFWNLIRFDEREIAGHGLAWLLRKDQCMHCADPGCLEACPAPGAIVQYQNGIVDVNPDLCIGCKYCATGCPFDVPHYERTSNKMAKCTLCVDRVDVGLEPACIKACPTGCLQFGTKDDLLGVAKGRVAHLKDLGFPNATVYDPPGVGGTSVITVLAHGDHPEWYGLPRDPHVPHGVRFWKKILRPLGVLAVAGAFVAAVGHYLSFGPKAVRGSADPGPDVPPLPPPPPRDVPPPEVRP